MLRSEAPLHPPTTNHQCLASVLPSQLIQHARCRRQPRCMSTKRQTCSVVMQDLDLQLVATHSRMFQGRPLLHRTGLLVPGLACILVNSDLRRDKCLRRHPRTVLPNDNSSSHLLRLLITTDRFHLIRMHLQLLAAALGHRPLLLQRKPMAPLSVATRTRRLEAHLQL